MHRLVQKAAAQVCISSAMSEAVNGMPPKRAMDWAQEQVVLAVKGQLKVQ